MTTPLLPEEESEYTESVITDDATPNPSLEQPYPDAMVKGLGAKNIDRLKNWLDEWLLALASEFSVKHKEWAEQESAYRARGSKSKSYPFEGACGDIIPVVAMAVDPVHARLDTGIFKNDPVYSLKALKKSYTQSVPALEQFIEFYQQHKLHLRTVVSPRLMELAKHGSMVLKTVYDREKYNTMTYDADWKPVEKEVTRFSGPRVMGIQLGNFWYPAGYEDLQLCPIVVERQRVRHTWLKVQEKSGKLFGVDRIKNQATNNRTPLETEHQKSANHLESRRHEDEDVEVYECWCDFDINGDGLPERLVATYHYDTGTLLQLRYNWYFHQRKPYTIIAYTRANESLGGIGIGEMTLVFQNAVTQWHQMASDNAYLSNIRMFIAAKDANIEENPRLYGGRVFRVNDPSKDLIPFRLGDTYSSTIQERQNLFGLAEKRTGISDYLTGRESPIVGSRATATSTLALIEEGTKRVEQVMENIRHGMAEVMENCIYIWMQYGLDDIDQIVFGSDEIADKVRDFFNTLTRDNVGGAIAVDLTTTDARQNRAAKQQVQMAIINVMMTYYQKFVELGQAAIQAAASAPAISAMMNDVAESARKLFRDLLVEYDIRNVEDYLPELEKYLAAATPQPGGPGVPPGPNGLPPGSTGVPAIPSISGGVPPSSAVPPQAGGVPRPGIPGGGRFASV